MMINNSISIPAFEELFETTAVQEVINVYVNKQVEKVRIEKDKEITELQTQLDTMAATILMGGAK